ncbi:MAG: carboxypeptidase regulatory-like domain-containing protein [Planctomycetes bacterium]|nr:carboxypeptidase regulatory-like domain-containing protein [Planctomycetota bacterium]
MRKLPLLLVGLIVACVVGYLLWSTRSGDAPQTAERATPSAPVPTSTAPASTEKSELAGPAAVAAAAEANDPTARTTQAESERSDASIKATLVGRVVLPEGTPADERLEVLASTASLSRSAPALPAARQVDGTWRATVGGDGSFTLPIGADTGTLHVAVEGRYLATRESVQLALPVTEPLELRPELGTWLRGTLVVPSALEGARAELTAATLELAPVTRGGFEDQMRQRGEFSRTSSRETKSADGRTFELRAVLGEGPFTVTTVPTFEPRPSFAFSRSTPFELAPGRALDVVLELTGGGTVLGVVVDERDAPVAGAKLTVEVDPKVMGFGGDEAREAKTDAAGRFELAAVRAGKGKLQIECDGYLAERVDFEVAEGERREGVRYVLSHGARIAGRVTWPDGTPAADARISVSFDAAALTGMNAFNAWRGNEGDAVTAADGTFSVGGLGVGPFVVRALAAPPGETWDDKAKDRAWRASVGAVAPDTLELVLTINAPEGVAGRVLDATGAPITKFELVAHAKVASILPGLGGDSVRRTFEDSDGRFVLAGLERGAWELYALADGFGDAEPLALELPRDASAPPIEFRLQRAAVVAGTVLGFDGRPVAGAVVGRSIGLADLKRRFAPSKEPDDVKTDDAGRFRLEPLSAGPLLVAARAPGAAASEKLELELAPGEVREDVTLTLRRGGTLIGELYGEDGKPLAGVNVIVQVPSQDSPQRMPSTDSSGRFREEHLEPGTWQVVYMPFLSGDGEMPSAGDTAALLGSMKMTSAVIKDGEETHVTLGAPPKDPVLVRGRVRSKGEAVGGVVVNFMPDGAKGLSSLKFVSVAADGTYETRLDGPGRYLVTVQSFGNAGEQQACEFAHRVPAEPEHVFDIELPGARLAGRVLDGEGKPAPKTRVSLTRRGAVPNGTILGGRYSEISTDDDGRYVMRWLEPGDYTLAAGGALFGGLMGGEGALGRELRELHVAADADMRDVDFRLKASGKVTGVVRAQNGKPVAGAAIFVRDEHEAPLERLTLAQTAADGRFTYHGLAEGRYSLTARSSDSVSSTPVAIAIRGGETTEVDLVIDAGTLLVVKLVDSKEQEVEATVLVTDEKGRQVNGLLTMAELMDVFQNGGFSSTEQRIGPLAPGLYTVTATAPDGRSASKSVSLGGQAERKLTLRLRE